MRSIFDPTGGEAERSGTRFTLPDADQVSQLPEQFINPPLTVPDGNIDFQPPPEKPPIEISSENGGKLLIIGITGKLHANDYKHCVPIVEKAIEEHGKIRLLVQMHHFHGWDGAALWKDVKFDVKHFNDIERLVIVGETTWEKWMAIFCKPFTKATIRYYASDQTAEARAWISTE
jgi:hypothetical protein